LSSFQITSLTPSSAAAEGPAFTLTVAGCGFVAGAVVEWSGSALSTTFITANQLTASVPAAFIAAEGQRTVVVVNPGGSTSNPVAFTVGPTLSISSFSPVSVTEGGPGFNLTVNGSGFVAGSAVEWNGSALPTSYVSATQLSVSVSASLIALPGSVDITVVNPGGAISNAVSFGIGDNLTIITASPLSPGTVGVSYSQAFSATGGVTPYRNWSVSTGNLPPGTSLSALGGFLTGLLEGIPTVGGTYTFNVQVTDDANTTVTKQFSMTINPSVGMPMISSSGIGNAASYAGGSVAPGELVVIFGSDLGPSTLAGLQVNSNGYVSTSLAGTQVLFDGIAAPLVYTEAEQVSAVVPYEVSGRISTQVQVVYQGQNSNVVAMPVGAVMPGVFTDNSSGQGQGAVVNQDGTVNSISNPASAGSVIFFYATGEGQTNPGGVDGQPDNSPAPTPVAQPITVTIGGINAQVIYAGGVPGLVAGVLQVNVQLPSGIATGNAVPFVLTVGGKASQSNVTFAVR
jgi:uncharacterized protein (TIGR03437 family)